MDSFHIYENLRAGEHKAVIHRGSCGDCNNGRGKAGGTSSKNGRWHGPYSSLEQAQTASAALRDVTNHREHRCVS